MIQKDMDTKVSVTREILEMKHMKIMRMFLWGMGAWPAESVGEALPAPLRWYRRQLPLQTLLVALGALYYIYINFQHLSFFILSDLFTTLFLSVITVPKTILVCLKRYQKIFRDFLTEYHLMHFKQQNGEYGNYINLTVNKISMWFTVYETIWVLTGLILFNFSPVFNSIKKGALSKDRPLNNTLEFSVNMAFPGFHCNDYFIFTSIWNFVSSYNCAVSVCMFDLAVMIMIFQIIGHIKIILHKVECLSNDEYFLEPKSATDSKDYKNNYMKMYSNEENKIFHLKLVEIINNHRIVVRFSEQISQCFGIAIASNLSFHLINGCIVLIMVFSNDPHALSRFLPVTVINFGELIQVCVIYEVVGLMSEKLVDAVYLVPWERVDNDNRRCLRYLLQRVQTPIQMTAAGCATVGVHTMLKIIKTNISYFMFFKTLN